MSDDTPTVQFSASADTPPPFQRPPTRPRPGPPSRGPVVLFVLLTILVVAAIVVLLVILDGRLSSAQNGAPTPSASTPPSPTAPTQPQKTAAPPATTAPAPEPAGVFTTLVVPQMQGGCNRQGSPTVMVTWATEDARSVWIAPGTEDATTGTGVELPLSGDQGNVPDSFTIDCSQRTNTFTITLVGDDGSHVNRTWTILVNRKHFGRG